MKRTGAARVSHTDLCHCSYANLLHILGNKIDKNLKIFEQIDKIKI